MKKNIAMAAIGFLTTIAPLTAHSQKTYEPSQYFDDRAYITPFGSYIFSDSDRDADDGWGAGLAIGKPVSPYWNLELRGMYEELDRESGGPGKYKNWSAGVDAHWFFLGRQGLRKWQSVQPYAILGAGGIRDRVNGDDDWSVYANAGLGILWPFADWGRLTLDGRYRWDDNHGDIGRSGSFGDTLVTLGLQIPLGPKPRIAEAPRPVPPTPAPPPKPEPAPEVKPAPPPPPPPPPKPLTRKFDVKTDGTFEFNKAVLTPEGKKQVDDIVSAMRKEGTTITSAEVIGHADPIGSEKYNQKLSEARANAIRDYMVSQGVPAGAIRAEGRGETQLKVTEAECKAKGQAKTRAALIKCFEPNRRVEVHVTGTEMQRQ
jgi:OOP family OmpA-OmpF porin